MKLHFHLTFFLLFFSSLFGNPIFPKDTFEVIEDEVYLSIRYQGVIDEIVVAYYNGEKFFLPLTELFDMFAINYEFDPAKLSISGYFLNKDTRYFLDFTHRIAFMGDTEYRLDINNFEIKELDYFVSPQILKEVFGLELIIDLSRLSIRLETKHELPIIKRHTQRYKEELRSKYGNSSNQEQYDLLMDRDPRMLDGALFDYSAFSTVTSERQNVSVSLNMGAEVLHGDIQGTLLSTINQDTGATSASNIRWRYANERQPWFSTVTLGEQSSTGLTNITFQGITITNQTLLPQRSYDTYLIDGTTDPEAEVELYQDGHLVEVIDADDVGYYRFMVPLNYGTSEFMLRIYGKQGRVIELERRIQIPFSFLPIGEFRYDLSGGRIASESLGWTEQSKTAASNLSYGMTNWLTGGIGAEYFENSNQDRPALSGNLSSRVAGDILVNLNIALENYSQLSIRGVGPKSSSFSMDHTYFKKKSYYNPLGIKQKLNMNLFYPFSIGVFRFTGRSTFSWTSISDKNRLKLNLDFNQFIHGIRLRYALKEQHEFSPTGDDISSEIILGAVYLIPRLPSIHSILRGSYFRTDLIYNSFSGSAKEIKFQYIKQFSSKMKTQLISSYNLQQQSFFFELGLTWDFNVLRSNSTLRTIRSVPSFTQTLRGSAGFDRVNGEMIWDSRQQVGRSGVSIRMYEDENNSRTYEPFEKLIPGNAITIEHASSRQVTKSGITRLTQLQPYRRYNFRVNEARINNPLLVPSIPKFSVVTDPNRYKRIDVPFYITGIIDGRVFRKVGDDYESVSGLRIHVQRDGDENDLILRTFSDGSYYSMEIPPGDYECWVDQSQLDFLKVESTPQKLSFTVVSEEEGDFIEGLDFILE